MLSARPLGDLNFADEERQAHRVVAARRLPAAGLRLNPDVGCSRRGLAVLPCEAVVVPVAIRPLCFAQSEERLSVDKFSRSIADARGMLRQRPRLKRP